MDNIVLLDNSSIALPDSTCIANFPVIPIMNIVFVIEQFQAIRLVLINPKDFLDGRLDGNRAQSRDWELSLTQIVFRKRTCDIFGVSHISILVARTGIFRKNTLLHNFFNILFENRIC